MADDAMEINIDLNVPLNQENQVDQVEMRVPPVENLPPDAPQPENPMEFLNQANVPRPAAQNTPNTNPNHLNAARFSDRLFHAMLVRVALKYSSRVSIKWRQVIEGFILFFALNLLASLLFIHVNFTRSPATCLNAMEATWIRKGILRIEVVRNLELLEEKEHFISQYISDKSQRVCHFNPADVFRFGPSVFPYGPKIKQEPEVPSLKKMKSMSYYSAVMNLFRPNLLFEEQEEDELYPMEKHAERPEEFDFQDLLEAEAHFAFLDSMKGREEENYEYMYRVEYAMLYGLLRLPQEFRDEHEIPVTWIRIDSKSHCFGDQLSRIMMRIFVGYEDAVVAALRQQAMNLSLVHPETNSMGYLHNLMTNEHFHFVANSLGKTSYVTAGILMIIFTFAISMLLRFSHHQIFVFIIDLLHMFELQQPLNPPVAPLVTVVLALVGMEAIMAEVFNDTSIAFYVILIVWVADQYDAICCHSSTSKKYWLRFFYIYQFFFYSYQYRFSGQYGGLALLTASMFILHSMIYFFHHYEMPLILYQDRVSQVLADLHAPQNGMGTVEVQTITVAVHNRAQQQPPPSAAAAAPENHHESEANSRPDDMGNAPEFPVFDRRTAEPLSPSSVFDARGPSLQPAAPIESATSSAPTPPPIEREPRNPEEIVAHQIVNEAMNELFNQE